MFISRLSKNGGLKLSNILRLSSFSNISVSPSNVFVTHADLHSFRRSGTDDRVFGSTGLGVISDPTTVGDGKVHFFNACGDYSRINSAYIVKSNLSPDVAVHIPLLLSAYTILTNAKLSNKDVIVIDSVSTYFGKLFVQVAKLLGLNVNEFSTAAPAGGSKAALSVCSDGSKLRDILRGVANNGSLVCMGDSFVSMNIPYSAAIFNNVSVIGFNFQTWAISQPEQYQHHINAVLPMLTSGKLTLPTVSSFSVNQTKESFSFVEKNGAAIIKL